MIFNLPTLILSLVAGIDRLIDSAILLADSLALIFKIFIIFLSISSKIIKLLFLFVFILLTLYLIMFIFYV